MNAILILLSNNYKIHINVNILNYIKYLQTRFVHEACRKVIKTVYLFNQYDLGCQKLTSFIE